MALGKPRAPHRPHGLRPLGHDRPGRLLSDWDGLLPGDHEIMVGARVTNSLRIDDHGALHQEIVNLATRPDPDLAGRDPAAALPHGDRGESERRAALRLVRCTQRQPASKFPSLPGCGGELMRNDTDERGRRQLAIRHPGAVTVTLHGPGRAGSAGSAPPRPASTACNRPVRSWLCASPHPSPARSPVASRASPIRPTAHCRLVLEDWNYARRQHPSADGTFSFANLPAGSYTILVRAPEATGRDSLGPFELAHGRAAQRRRPGRFRQPTSIDRKRPPRDSW